MEETDKEILNKLHNTLFELKQEVWKLQEHLLKIEGELGGNLGTLARILNKEPIQKYLESKEQVSSPEEVGKEELPGEDDSKFFDWTKV